MKKTGKKLMMTAAIIFAAGIVLAILGIMLGGWPGFQISRAGITSVNKVEEPYELKKTKLNKFTMADIVLDYADIEVRPSEDNNYYVEYLLSGSSGQPVYEVSNDTFKFRQKDDNSHFLFLGSIEDRLDRDPYICLYVPKDTKLRALNLSGDSGECEINGMKVESANVTSDYGDYKIENCTFDELVLSTESSDLKMKNSTAAQFTFTGSYGDIELKNFSSDAVTLDLESYDVEIEAAKLGDLDYTNEYGELELTLPEKLDTYSFDISVEYGDIQLPKSAPIGQYSDEDGAKTYRAQGSTERKINIISDSGDVVIR